MTDRGSDSVRFPFGQKKDDAMASRIQKSFDRFHDVRHLSDPDIAMLARSEGVDIAIDLNGYTKHSRPGIFSAGAAPVQVNYLGFPGTMGSQGNGLHHRRSHPHS